VSSPIIAAAIASRGWRGAAAAIYFLDDNFDVLPSGCARHDLPFLPLLRLLSGQLWRGVLRHKVRFAFAAEFVGAAIDNRRRAAKIFRRSRRSDTPFKCCGPPGVVFIGA